MGGAVCSVAAGHGRNWGQGAVTGCYGPLLLGARERLGAVSPLIELKGSCLPEEVLSLVRPPVDGSGEVLFYNGSGERTRFAWRPSGDREWQTVGLAPEETRIYRIESEE